MPETPVRVLSAMSGGVDSSMATALLIDQGHEVTGAMMRFWPDERPEGAFDLCCSPNAAYDARRIAERIDIPFYLLDYRNTFAEVVIDPFIPAYQKGETPNPCVWCNREIKFGSFIKKAEMLSCDYIATGHYVRRIDGAKGVELHRGIDNTKDQTYFLWALSREILPKILFPLGDLSKNEVRKLAEARDFITFDKKSSHGLCFITSSVHNYLSDFSEPNPGLILDASDDFKEVGQHQGLQFYTIGQKKGLGLYHSHVQRFVLELRAEENTVIVGTRDMCHWLGLRVNKMNLLVDKSDVPREVMAQTRYRQRPVEAELDFLEDGFELRFADPSFAVTIGQSAVIYDGTRLLGGGVIYERR